MENHVARLTAFTEAIAASRSQLFEEAVRAAYAAGARHSDLLTAVDIAKALAAVPAKLLARAYRMVDDLRWMEAQRVRMQQAAQHQGAGSQGD